MADQHHDDTPKAANSVLTDIANMNEMHGFHKDCFEQICEGWSDTDATSLKVDNAIDATSTTAGFVEFSTDAETATGTAINRAVTPANLKALTASTSLAGIVELATDAEVLAMSDTGRAVVPSSLDLLFYGLLCRPLFTYNGAATAYTIKVGGAQYMCKDKYCYWTSELTTGAIGTPAASTAYYLYLDYSAITSGTAITNSELIWSSTAPTYNHTYRSWMNGDDLCIFAVTTNGTPTNINIFYHDGDYVQYDEEIEIRASGALTGTVWTDIDGSGTIPDWGDGHTFGQFTIHCYGSNTNAIRVRKNGSSATNGMYIDYLNSFNIFHTGFHKIALDGGQIFEIKSDGAALAEVNTIGWWLPTGM